MSNRAVTTADQILELVQGQVGQLYGEPAYTFVRNLGELDSALFHWHWLYATATCRMDDFIAGNKFQTAADALRHEGLVKSNEEIGDTENTRAVSERWNKISDAIGLAHRP